MPPHFVLTPCPDKALIGQIIEYGCIDVTGTANDDIVVFTTIRDPLGRVFTTTLRPETPSPKTYKKKVYLSAPGNFEIEMLICEKNRPGMGLTVHDNLGISIGCYWL